MEQRQIEMQRKIKPTAELRTGENEKRKRQTRGEINRNQVVRKQIQEVNLSEI